MTRENTKLSCETVYSCNVHSVCLCVSSVTEFCSFVQTKRRQKGALAKKKLHEFYNYFPRFLQLNTRS